MPEDPTNERLKCHHYRRGARDRGHSRSRSPERTSHRERDKDEPRHRDRKRSRSRDPYHSHKRSESRKEWDRLSDHEEHAGQSESRGRSVTPRGHHSNSPYSLDSSDSRRPAPAKRSGHRLRSSSRSYERSHLRHRSPSRSGSRDKESRRSKHGERDHDRKKRRKDKEKKVEREEKRSVLTGKKIKLKVHKDHRDLMMDANREDLLQFLNSTCE